jgi:probable HAF family extracellular repeat protein
MSFRRTLVVWAVAGLALGACSDGGDLGNRSGVGAGIGEAGLHLQLTLPFHVGVARVKFEIVPVDCGSGMPLPGEMPGIVDRPIEELRLPGGNQELGGQPLADGSIHYFADLFMVLDPGCYDVTATPSPPEICQPAHAYNVRVPVGGTAEVFLVSQCQGQGRGAIDVATAFNRPPVLRDVAFAQSKFTATCEVQRVCATAVDVDQDPLEFDWRAVGDAPAHAGPRVVSTESNTDGSVTQCAELVPHAPARLLLEVTAFDLVRRGGDWVRVEDWLAAQGDPAQSRSSLQFPVYAVTGRTPSMHETCGNGLDDDCDGTVDESDCQAVALRYHMTTIVPPGTRGSCAAAINEQGQVVGHAFSDGPLGAPYSAWMFDAGVLSDLGALSEDRRPTSAADINERGDIVGGSTNSEGAMEAFRIRDGVMRGLGQLVAGGRFSDAIGINDRGQAVGAAYAQPGSGSPLQSLVAFITAGPDLRSLGTLGGNDSVAVAINNHQVVVGNSTNANGHFRPFRWTDGQMVDIGTLGGATGQANDINDRGQIVGRAENLAGRTHAFLLDGGTMKDLGSLGAFSGANAISENTGDVVGDSEVPSRFSHAVLWRGGVLLDLNTLVDNKPADITLAAAADVNDRGEIVGCLSSPDHTGDHSFLLRPIAGPP